MGKGVRVLRASVYSAHHKSFAHRVFAFISFMVSSFWLGLGVKNVDLVWGTSPPIFQGVTAWALARLKGAKFLFEVRDLWPQFAIAVGVLTNPLLIRASEWLERFLYRHADRVIVNSPGYREHVQSRGAKRVELVPNGSDPSMFDPADEGASFRTRHLLADKFVALYAGAHGMSNDLGVVLEAAKILQEVTVLTNPDRAARRRQGEGQFAGAGGRDGTDQRDLCPVGAEVEDAGRAGRSGCLHCDLEAARRVQDHLPE